MRNYRARIQKGLSMRIRVWEAMKGEAGSSPMTKMVRQSETTAAFHRPGSQNRKKSGTGYRSNKH